MGGVTGIAMTQIIKGACQYDETGIRKKNAKKKGIRTNGRTAMRKKMI